MAEIKVKNGADGLVNSTTDLSATHVKASNDIYSRDRETSPNKSADYNSPTTHKPLISSSDDLDLVRLPVAHRRYLPALLSNSRKAYRRHYCMPFRHHL